MVELRNGTVEVSRRPSLRTETTFSPPQFIDVYHELGTLPEDAVIKKAVPIDPQAPPTAVVVRSHIVGTGMRSPAYLATIRRRGASKTARLIRALDARQDEPDFPAWTQEALQELRRLIQELSSAERHRQPLSEGNSCEILRQLRDTFLNDGWKRYREPKIRDAAVKLLQKLGSSDDISADDVDQAVDQLLDLGLTPAIGMVWDVEEKEAEVPD